MVRTPPPLTPGSEIRIVSPALPSMAVATARAERARRAIESLGLRVGYSRHCHEDAGDGWSAGTGRQRADDLHDAFLDPQVGAIMSAVGGATTREVLPYLDADLIRANPKIFVGRSDNIFLNAFLCSRADLASFYGVTFLAQFGEPPVPMPETAASFQSVLMGGDEVVFRRAVDHSSDGIDWMRSAGADHPPRSRCFPGREAWLGPAQRVTAPLVGGELHLLIDLLRMDLISLEGKILFWDINFDYDTYTGEKFAEISELVDLTTLRGMVVGDNPRAGASFDDWVQTVSTVLESTLGTLPYPVQVGGDVGHYDPAWTIPYGDLVTLDPAVGLIYRARHLSQPVD